MDIDNVTPIRSGISLEEMLERKRDCSFTYFGREINFSYWVERITHEFRADMLRLGRATIRLEQRTKVLTERVSSVTAALDADAATEEDDAAEAAIQQLRTEDDIVKAQIDAALANVVCEMNVTIGGKPAPITPETFAKIDSAFEGMMVGAILKDSQGLGEPTGQQPTKPLPFTSKPKARPERTRRHRTG